MNVKKPGVQNQANIRSGMNPDSSKNPLDSIINNPNGQNSGMDPTEQNYSVSNFNSNFIQKGEHNKLEENYDKEMQDVSNKEHNYGESVMAKSKASALDLRAQSMNNSYPHQSTFLQDSGSKIKILQSSSEKTLKVAWNPKNHYLAFGGDKEKAYLWNMDENIENAELIDNLPHISPELTNNSMMPDKAMITAVDWKPDGSMFITAATDGI